MTQDNTVKIIVAILSSNVLVSLVTAVVTFISNAKKNKIDISKEVNDIKNALHRHECDICRSQLLTMMSDYPEDHQEIMKLAHHYFCDLKGNWYMTSIFNNWLIENKIGKPEWFDSNQ